MIRRPVTAALIPITLAVSIAATSCSSDGGQSGPSGHRSSKPAGQATKAAPISFDFKTDLGFRYRFTGTSAFYNATGDPGFPMASALPPGLTYLVLYGKLSNLLKDRPAPNPTESKITTFGGLVIRAQQKRIPTYTSSGDRAGSLQTCAWPSGGLSDNKDELDLDGVPTENQIWHPNDVTLVAAKNSPNLCVTTLGLNKTNFPDAGIPPSSSYRTSIFCIVPDSMPKNMMKFAVWREPSEYDELQTSKYTPDPINYHYITSSSVRTFPWSPVPKLGNN
jgi:hypothetical protein